MIHWLWRLPGLVEFLLFGPAVERPETDPPAQEIVHVHQWDRCRYYGQYWYSKCIANETCQAKRAC